MKKNDLIGTRLLAAGFTLFLCFAGSHAALAETPEILWSYRDLIGGITSVDFSPSGRFIAYSASADPEIRVRRARDGALVRSFTADTDTSAGVDQVAFSPDERSLASTWNRLESVGGYTLYFGGLGIWDGFSPPSLEAGSHANYCTSLAWAPDSSSLLSGSTDRYAILWDTITGEEIRRFHHGAWIQSVAFSPDGESVATGASDHVIKLWRVSDGALIRTLSGHTDYVRTLTFSPDGSGIASGAGGFDSPVDHTIKIWRVADGELLETLSGHGDWVLDLSFAWYGFVLVSASLDGTIRFWRVADGAELLRYDVVGGIPISLDVAPGSRTFVYGLNDGTVVHGTY